MRSRQWFFYTYSNGEWCNSVQGGGGIWRSRGDAIGTKRRSTPPRFPGVLTRAEFQGWHFKSRKFRSRPPGETYNTSYITQTYQHSEFQKHDRTRNKMDYCVFLSVRDPCANHPSKTCVQARTIIDRGHADPLSAYRYLLRISNVTYHYTRVRTRSSVIGHQPSVTIVRGSLSSPPML